MTISAIDNRPILDVDPFDQKVMADPVPTDTAIREAGPAVWIPRYEFWAVGGNDEARKIFSDHETFSSASGTGLTNIKSEKSWRAPSAILDLDPPDHTVRRQVMARLLSPAAVAKLRDTFTKQAEEMVDALVEKREFDAAQDLSFAFPFKVLPDAIGMQKEGREHLIPYATLNFNAMGPKNDRYHASAKAAEGSFEYVKWQCSRENLEPGKIGAKFYEAADAGDITEEVAGMLVRTFLSAGIDTTIFGIGLAIHAMISAPEQWVMLHENPNLARRAFDESLRYTPPSPMIGRTTTKATQLGDVQLGAAEKVVMFLSAANRDPRRWENPDKFDLNRNPVGHLAFGTGIHGCVGQVLARLEAESVLKALAQRVQKIEFNGVPERRFINWLRGYGSIPVRVTPA